MKALNIDYRLYTYYIDYLHWTCTLHHAPPDFKSSLNWRNLRCKYDSNAHRCGGWKFVILGVPPPNDASRVVDHFPLSKLPQPHARPLSRSSRPDALRWWGRGPSWDFDVRVWVRDVLRKVFQLGKSPQPVSLPDDMVNTSGPTDLRPHIWAVFHRGIESIYWSRWLPWNVYDSGLHQKLLQECNPKMEDLIKIATL